MAEIFKAVPAVYLIMERGDEALFMHRHGTGYQDGMYMLSGGGVERGEPPTVATAREANEELGIEVDPSDLVLAHVMYRAPHDATGERVDFFFRASKWRGEPEIREPHKCDGLVWFTRDDLPESVPPYVRIAMKHIREGMPYSEEDWPSPLTL